MFLIILSCYKKKPIKPTVVVANGLEQVQEFKRNSAPKDVVARNYGLVDLLKEKKVLDNSSFIIHHNADIWLDIDMSDKSSDIIFRTGNKSESMDAYKGDIADIFLVSKKNKLLATDNQSSMKRVEDRFKAAGFSLKEKAVKHKKIKGKKIYFPDQIDETINL